VDHFCSGRHLEEEPNVIFFQRYKTDNPEGLDILFHIKGVGPIAGRELLLRRKILHQKFPIILWWSVERPDIPVAPKYIRSTSAAAIFIEPEEKDILLHQVYYVNPRGSIPAWMVNSWASAGIKAMQKMKTRFPPEK